MPNVYRRVNIRSMRIEMEDGSYFDCAPEMIKAFDISWVHDLKFGKAPKNKTWCEISITFLAPSVAFGVHINDEMPLMKGEMGFLKGTTIMLSPPPELPDGL